MRPLTPSTINIRGTVVACHSEVGREGGEQRDEVAPVVEPVEVPPPAPRVELDHRPARRPEVDADSGQCTMAAWVTGLLQAIGTLLLVMGRFRGMRFESEPSRRAAT